MNLLFSSQKINLRIIVDQTQDGRLATPFPPLPCEGGRLKQIFVMLKVKIILPLLARNSPRILKALFLPAFFSFQQHSPSIARVRCLTDPLILSQTISNIDKNVIRIQLNGDLVGEAFCFSDNYLVSVSYELQDHHGSHPKEYDFLLGDRKLPGTFRIVGHFQNLTFFQHTSQDGMKPLPYEPVSSPFLISPVQIYMKREYPSIRNGYMVARDSGFGIVDGRGEIGGLVIKNGKAAGIVTQVGRNLESGFLRVIEWSHLSKILKFLKKNKQCYFGISAQAQQFKEGIEVVRVAPNSPLKNELMMGDTILKANGYLIREVEALQRICVIADGHLTLEVMREDTPIEIKVRVE